MRINIPYLLLTILLFSCNRTEKIEVSNPITYFEALITDDKDAIFKNINFDFTIDDVANAEKSKQYDSTETYLAYSYDFPKDTSKFIEYADIKYFFDEQKILKIITANIYLNDSIQEIQLLENFKEYYTHKYGSAKLDDYQYYTWDATADSKNTKGKYYFNIGIKKLDGDYGVALELLRQ